MSVFDFCAQRPMLFSIIYIYIYKIKSKFGEKSNIDRRNFLCTISCGYAAFPWHCQEPSDLTFNFSIKTTG